MKNKLRAIILGLTLGLTIGLAYKVRANVITFYGAIVNEALATNQAFVFDLNKNNVASLSVQVSISSLSASASSFTDGSESTGTVTISSWSALNASRSEATITIASNTATDGSLSTNMIWIASNSVLAGTTAWNLITISSNVNSSTGVAITFNGTVYRSSVDWFFGASTAATVINLTRFIDSLYDLFATTQEGTGYTIKVYAPRTGAIYNNYTMSSSTPFIAAVAFSSFSGGSDPVTLTINNQSPINKQRYTAGVQYAVGVDSQTTALNLARAISGSQYGIQASTSFTKNGSSVTLTVTSTGAIYNSYTLATSSAGALAILSSTFTGGQDVVTIRINGVALVNGTNWFTGNTSTDTVLSIASAIVATPALYPTCVSTFPANPPFSFSTGACSGGIISISTGVSGANGFIILTALSTGSAYVYPIATSSQTAATLSGVSATWSGATVSAIMGGRDNAFLKFGTMTYQNGKEWYAVKNNTETAASIARAINGSVFLSTFGLINVSISSQGVVYTTSVQVGSYWNFAMVSSSNTAMTLSGTNATLWPGLATSTMTGGTDLNYSTITDIINVPNRSLVNAQAVFLSTVGGATITPLSYGSTYFVIFVDTSNIKLALTSSGAVAGIPIDLIGLTTQTAAHTFTLNPIPISGNSFVWFQVSNDSATWFNIGSGTVPFIAPYVAVSTYTDMGYLNGRMIRARVTGSTSGATNVNVTLNGRE